MEKTKKTAMTAMGLIALFSLAMAILEIDGFQISGLTLIIGIAMYFILQKGHKSSETNTLSLQKFKDAFKDKKMVLLLVVPLLMNLVAVLMAKAVLPEFINHITARTAFLSTGTLLLLILQLGLMALGEEIAWRGFFQKEASKQGSSTVGLLLTSFLFTILHAQQGSFPVVAYDLLFIFINTLFYGFFFKKTDSVLFSALSHFLDNTFGILMLLFI